MFKTNVVGLSGNLDVQFDGQQFVRKHIYIFILSQYNLGVAVDLYVLPKLWIYQTDNVATCAKGHNV
jgi:hypothetical protein